MSERDEPAAPPALGLSAAHPLMGVEPHGVSGGCGGGGGASAVNGSAPTAAMAAAAGGEAGEEPPRKRVKLTALEADASSLRRRIIECELLRLRNLRERLTDQLSELYFLQAGGNMMDYAIWRKRPPAPQLLAFLEARRPPPVSTAAVAAAMATSEPVAVVPEPAPAPSPTPAPAPAPAPAPVERVLSAADEMVEKAKQEAWVASRVAELARAGLWAERRLPRVLEPPRPKSHWDYVLEEMAWLAQDFAHERKWKKQAAKKCARAVQKYFQDKAHAAQKAEKAHELHLRKIAAFAAKEIRTFWANVEKLVEWKRVRRVEAARKEALDEQLSYIVDKTERYSRALAATLHAPQHAPPDTPPSDEEFTPRGDSDDDEETIAAAEREAGLGAADHRAELDALRHESRRPLSDLLPPGYESAATAAAAEYRPEGEDSADDESTIAEQERVERGADDHAAEINALRADAHLDLDELRRLYSRPPPSPHASTPTGTDTGTDTDTDTEEEDEDASSIASSSSGGTRASSSSPQPLAALVAGAGEGKAEGQDVERAASVAATLQPTGTTLSETAVGTPVPALLRHALREYQHVGLHWLATMHARGLNGILADEMGLGKTVQTIALLAHLALERRDWGPHLVVAPTSVVLNWEMEFKKWCPAFKILTYYGTIKERKLKRVGWTKPNSFHVCITSYKLVVQDHQSFRRKRWKYLVLDEAQNIKNFKSQRWQLLLNFQTERRLLLTGTPLQNSLVELWSLMHFLMPGVFASHSEFRWWFGDVSQMAEGSARYDEALVRRLHAVLRPFLLRRLKAHVERQLPTKHEHVLLCRLAKRQRCLYDDFMSRAKTKESLASGNLLSVINVLMQLRKVCNHPDLFEPRAPSSPLHLPALRLHVPALALDVPVRARAELAARLGGALAHLEAADAQAFAAHRARHLAPPPRAIEELCRPTVAAPPQPPPASLRLHLRLVPRAPPPASVPAPAQRAPLRSLPRAPPAPPARPEAGGSGGACARLASARRARLAARGLSNERRCWRLPLYGADLRAAVLVESVSSPVAPPRSLEAMLHEVRHLIDGFTVCWRACVASAATLCAGAGVEGAREWRAVTARVEAEEGAAVRGARAALGAVHCAASRQAVAFPHPRLLQYDCGKLQVLDALLRRLKAHRHRVLIFTQMTRVLDLLEAFLSLHGHAYLRLDGATRVDRRQALVERFNADARVFAFLLSTRSGGVGLNLTGADAVVFYDSDWNPAMDAQAQDRCHRIGQTRDVHVYRLVTSDTVEQNIHTKAHHKRNLNALAIDRGRFTTSYLRGASIKELFGGSAVEGVGGAGVGAETETEVESALAAAEEEADAAAASAAAHEQHADLAEFDETVPLDEPPDADADADTGRDADRDTDRDRDPPETELESLMAQLRPVERYAMSVVERRAEGVEAERAALHDMRRQLHDWERARADLRAETSPPASPPDAALTYPRAEIWIGGNGDEPSPPAWCPPTPPRGDSDVYCESWARPLYRAGAASDAHLPPAATRRDTARARPPRAARPAPRPHHPAPLSLFERGGARPRARPRAAPSGPPPAVAAPPSALGHAHALALAEWSAAEDAALRRALRLQRLPAEGGAALAPNWEWVAELVAEPARAYRSPRACRDRHDALADPERARRRHRRSASGRARARSTVAACGAAGAGGERPPLHRLEAVRDASERRRATPRRRPDERDAPRNPKHAALLADHGIDYDAPPTPMEVASRRADRIAREKLKAHAPPAAAVAVVSVAPAAQAAPTPPRAAPAPAAVPLAYRPQPFPTRHLKIVHQAPPTASLGHQVSAAAGGGVGAGMGAADGAPAALRKLQLQQLALRRAAAPPGGGSASAGTPTSSAAAGPPTPHVVVAHLAPRRDPDPRI